MYNWDQVSDKTFAYLELKENFAFSKIPNIESYIQKNFALAENVAKNHQLQNLKFILQKANVQVRYLEDDSRISFSQIQSQILYEKDHKSIDIFLSCIREKKEALSQFGYNVSTEELISLHLAHEFYHFYEFEYDKRTSELLPKVNYMFLGIFPKKACVIQSSEVAAHRFAQVICNFPIHPKLIDYFYLIYKNIYTESDVIRIINSANTF